MPNQPNPSTPYDQIIQELQGKETKNKEEIIYGLYDNSDRPFLDKINDELINRSRISIKEKAYFFHLLAVMIDAGISMVQALKILNTKTGSEHFRRIINTLAYNVEMGKTLSYAMARFPEVFTEAEIGIVKSGEAIGHLDKMLIKLAEQLEATYEIYLKVKSALTYPILVITTLCICGVIVILFVIPKLVDFFRSSSAELPTPTKILIWFSDFMGQFWWALLALILISFIALASYFRTESGRLRLDYYKLTIPFIGELWRNMIIAKFARMLGLLVAAGLPITKTLEIVATSMGNEIYKRKLLRVKEKVQTGEKISANLQDASFLFPPVVTKMLSIGENSASLDTISEKMAMHYEQEISHSVKNLTSILEPIVILTVALLVGFMAWAIISPIFSLSDVVSQQ